MKSFACCVFCVFLLNGAVKCCYAIQPSSEKPGMDLAKLAESSYEAAMAEWQAGTRHGSEEALYTWSKRWMDAEGQEGDLKKQLAAAGSHVDRMQKLADLNHAEQLGLGGNPAPECNVKYYLAEAIQHRDKLKAQALLNSAQHEYAR